MFESIDQIVTIVSWIVAVVSFVSGTIITVVTKIRTKNLKACASLRDRMLYDMIEAESMFASLKKENKVSELKKAYVLQDLECYSLQNGVKFDRELWSAEIEHMIEFSDSVNAKADVSSGDRFVGGYKK